VILTARRASFMLAATVAASALGGLLLYRYFNPGALGPLPDMYEPFWYGEKTLTAVAEAAATIAAHRLRHRLNPRHCPAAEEYEAGAEGDCLPELGVRRRAPRLRNVFEHHISHRSRVTANLGAAHPTRASPDR
jgi:hypothetical protein